MAPTRTGDEVSQPIIPTDKTPAPTSRLVHRSFHQTPATVLSASGLDINLSTGQNILDACSGAAVAVLGHGHPEVTAAMIKQANDVSYVHTQAFTTPVAEELANIILEGSPAGLEMAFFVGSGSEAVEAALKMARQFHFENGEEERLHFVARRQGYHGNTIAAMSVSSNVARKIPYQGFGYPHVSHVTPAFPYRYMNEDENEAAFTERLLREIEDEFLRVGPEKVVAFLAEPVVGATAGCVPPPKGYFSGVRRLCNKYGILLILDEVMCGTGRCGTYFAFQEEGEDVIPDIVTVAKGVGGGYAPIGGVLMHRRVVNMLKNGSGAFVHGHTYQAHPISCATALAVQKIIKRDNLVARSASMGKVLEQRLREQIQDLPSVGDVRGRGLFWAVEFVKDKKTKETFDPKIGYGVKVQQGAFEKGVAVYPGAGTVDGLKGDHVLLAPPFIVTEEQLEFIVKVLKEAIEEQEKAYL